MAFYRDNLHSGEPSLWIATAVEDGACRVIAVRWRCAAAHA